MNYFRTTASLDFMEEGGKIHWAGWGFEPYQIRTAVQNGFQQPAEGKLVSLFPIADELLLTTRLGELPATLLELESFGVVTEAEAVAERDALKAINDAAALQTANTPTDDDIYKAQQLKLLTQISLKLGGTQNG